MGYLVVIILSAYYYSVLLLSTALFSMHFNVSDSLHLSSYSFIIFLI